MIYYTYIKWKPVLLLHHVSKYTLYKYSYVYAP